MVSPSVILTFILPFLILIKGQPNVGYGQCEDMRQGYFSHYYCTLQCFGEILHLSYARGDLCKGIVEFGSNERAPVPLPVVGNIIECITVRCRSAVPPSVCDDGSGYQPISKNSPENEKAESKKKDQGNTNDYQSDDYSTDDHDAKNDKASKDLIEEGNRKKSIKNTVAADSIAYDDNINIKSDNSPTEKNADDYYNYYDDYLYYDDDYYEDGGRKNDYSDNRNNRKKIIDEKKSSVVDSEKKSDNVLAIVGDGKGDGKLHDMDSHNAHYDKHHSTEELYQNQNINLETVSNEETKSDEDLETDSSARDYFTESIKQDDNKESSNQKIVAEISEPSTKEESIVEKSHEDSTKDESAVKKPDGDSIKEKNVVEKSNDKSTKEGSTVQKSDESSSEEESTVQKSEDTSSEEESTILKSDEAPSEEESTVQKSDEASSEEKSVSEKSDKDSPQEENAAEKPSEDLPKKESTVEESNKDSNEEENIAEKSNEDAKNEESATEISNQDSKKEEIATEKSNKKSEKEESIVEKFNDDSTKEENVVEKSNADSTTDESVVKNSNEEATKDESIIKKSSENSENSANSSPEKKDEETPLATKTTKDTSNENIKDSSSIETIKDSTSTECTENSSQTENPKEKSSDVLESNDESEISNYDSKKLNKISETLTTNTDQTASSSNDDSINKGNEDDDEYYYYYLSFDEDKGFQAVPISKNGDNSDSNKNMNQDYQDSVEINYPNYDTDSDKSTMDYAQLNTDSNNKPISHTKTISFPFNKNSKYGGSNGENTAFASSESDLDQKTVKKDFLTFDIPNENNQFTNGQSSVGNKHPIPNNARNADIQNNNPRMVFHPPIPSKQQPLGQNLQNFNVPQNVYAMTQANDQAGPQNQQYIYNHPLNPPVYQNQFMPYPYGNTGYNLRGQPDNQYWGPPGVPNQGNIGNIQFQNPGVTQTAPNIFWNPNPIATNQHVFPPNNAPFLNYGPSNILNQPPTANMRPPPPPQLFGQLPPWNTQQASTIANQPTSWIGNGPPGYPAPSWNGPVNKPPAAQGATGTQAYQGQSLGSDKGLSFENINGDLKIKLPDEVIDFSQEGQLKVSQNS